jgi:hypothetical protein
MSDPARRLAHTLEDRGLRWEVLSHEMLPGGALTWLRVTPAASDLASAMLARDLVIEETGVVAKLRVLNPSRGAVLLPADLVVDGGKQARVVERSVIIPSFAVCEVPVRCVEAGRWQPQNAQTAAKFDIASTATTGSREELMRMKQQTLQKRNAYELDQNKVWEHVDAELSRTRCTSQTRSYTAFLSMRAARVAEARRLDIQPPSPANALALVRKSSVWIEVFPTRDDMCSIVPTVVADALEPGGAADESPMSLGSRTELAIHAIQSAALAAIPPLPATIGDSFALEGAGTTGFALIYGGRVAHLVATVAC